MYTSMQLLGRLLESKASILVEHVPYMESAAVGSGEVTRENLRQPVKGIISMCMNAYNKIMNSEEYKIPFLA